VPLFEDRMFTGLYTQRAILHDPSDVYTARFYGGRPDALITGRNIELTNRLTLQRRPGMIPFRNLSLPGQGFSYPTRPDRAFSFQLSNGNIQVIIDTGSSGNLTVTSVGTASGGIATYNGTFPGGASNGYAGLNITISGFTTNGAANANDGTFVCTASTLTTLTLANPNAFSQTQAAVAVTSGGIYLDNQNGTATLLFAKAAGAGQAYFVAVAGVLYFGDGVDVKKYTPLNTNGIIWNWGVAAPTAGPTVVTALSGAASSKWQASTVFSTMGLTIDTNSTTQIWQVISVTQNGGTNTSFGTTGNGEPNWGSAPNEGNTIGDGTVIWTNVGPVNAYKSNSFYADLGWFGKSGASTSQPTTAIVGNIIYGNYQNSGGIGEDGSPQNMPKFNGLYPGPSGGYGDFNCHWFAIGSFATTATMANLRWKRGVVYPGWQSGGSSNQISGSGQGSFIVTNNLPAPSGTTVNGFVATTGGTSSGGYSPFPANYGFGNTVVEGAGGTIQWLCLGPSARQSSTPYTAWVAAGTAFGCVYDGTNLQVCTVSGTTGSAAPGGSIASATSITVAANTPATGQATYTLGAGSWVHTPVTGDKILVSGFVNAANNGNGQNQTVVSATSNTIVVNNINAVNETHSATIAYNPWGTGYGTTTQDGSVTWVCVGPSVAWAAAQTWNFPTGGFAPPLPSNPQGGGSSVNGTSSGDVEYVTSSGTSGGGSEPIWTAPTTPSDGTITWTQGNPTTTQSLAWSFGFAYAYSYKARATTDSYSPTSVGGGGLTPPGVSTAFTAPTGSETNAISTASPVTQIASSSAGGVNTISGFYSSDPQVDTIVIWRSADSASGSGSMFELTEIPNIVALGGTNNQWHFKDFLPSTPATISGVNYPGLNTLQPAPINSVNNPPNSAYLPQVYNYQRIWGSQGQQVNFSGGPDTEVGNPNEAFNPSDELPFLAPVIRLVRTPQGIVTFLTDSIEMIGGGPATATFFSTTLAPGIGLLSYNACDVFAGEIYFFSADNQFRVITPALNVSSFGFPIGDQLANQPTTGISDTTWTPANVYVAVHQSGTDSCIFLADGSTGWYRLNPHQIPGGSQGPEPIWSPYATITGGVGFVQSVETTPGIRQLLGGPNGPGGINTRSLTTFTDNVSGTPTKYDANFVMGSINLVHPGEIALLKFLEFDFSGTNFQPTVSYLLNEISGTFTSFVNGANGVPQFDPPDVYGATLAPTSYSPNRYYFATNSALARCRHLQVKVDYGSTSSNGDEVYTMTIYGRRMVEG
jgi:hypothetical protein